MLNIGKKVASMSAIPLILAFSFSSPAYSNNTNGWKPLQLASNQTSDSKKKKKKSSRKSKSLLSEFGDDASLADVLALLEADSKKRSKKKKKKKSKKERDKDKLSPQEKAELEREEAKTEKEKEQKMLNRKLYNAVRAKNYEDVKKYVLLKADTNYIRSKDNGETLLHIAVSQGDINATRVLIAHGANVNAFTIKNWTPMHHATRFGHLNIVKYLLQHGGNIYVQNTDGKSPYYLAHQLKHADIIKYLNIWRKYH